MEKLLSSGSEMLFNDDVDVEEPRWVSGMICWGNNHGKGRNQKQMKRPKGDCT